MTIQLTTEQVWQAIEKELFAVIGMVTARHEARVAINGRATKSSQQRIEM